MFACFSGTTRLSDFPVTCMSGLWHRAFPDRSLSNQRDVAGISQFPRGKLPSVRVVFDSVGLTSDSPLTFDISVAFPVTGQGRPPQITVFGAQYTARTFSCERFDWMVAHTDASLGAKAIGEILPRTKLPFATLLRLSLAHPDPLISAKNVNGNFSHCRLSHE